jgi:ribosomal protein L17
MARKLGRATDQRMAVLKNQVSMFLWNGKLETTLDRAKEVRRLAEKYITLAMRTYEDTVTVTKEKVNLKNEKVAVENIQRYLRQLAQYDHTIPMIAIDGIYGTETAAAIAAFQRNNQLDGTGIADYTTWTLLYEEYMRSVLLHSSPRCFCPFPRFPVNYSVGIGNRQFLVEIIQYILNELTLNYDDIPRNEQNGYFDEDTERAIIIFQRIHDLPATGRVDKFTWNALVEAYQRLSERNN